MSTSKEGRDQSGVQPALLPTTVDFHYPGSDGTSSAASSVVGHGQARDKASAQGLKKSASEPQNRPQLSRKAVTERPGPVLRKSTFWQNRHHLNRRVTGGSTALNDAVWSTTLWSDSESSWSSSDDDDSEETGHNLHHGNSATSPDARKAKSKLLAGDTKDTEDGQYGQFAVGNDQFKTKGKVSKRDGRLKISVREYAQTGYLAKALGASLRHHLGPNEKEKEPKEQRERRKASVQLPPAGGESQDTRPQPQLNIVIMVIGSRGDIQPFLKIGKVLKQNYGHRVRIATHPAFKKFVEKDTGLDFFSVGGDPAELMAFMVKNPGLVPSFATVKSGEIGRRRTQMSEMFQGFWRACINSTDDETDIGNLKMMGEKAPFVADAIIANPPCFAHVHCAEKLGIPLHLMFTFPYSPTQSFPHPLANIKRSNVDAPYTNFMSYPLVEMMTWQGLGDLVNNFRVKSLKLEPVSTLWAPGQLYRLKVPFTYLWSPGLVPKPPDWGPEIDVAGFVFLDLATSYKPPEELTEFLEAGPPPVYIGFGSIVVDDPDKFTAIVFGAVQKAGVRALVSKGWGGLGEGDVPENIHLLGNVPHDWLFPRVSAVVHHGGAGTTAIGLKCGRPTMIVPFFGDQPFWGARCAQAGAGSLEPVPYKHLTADRLAQGIRECLTPEAKDKAAEIAASIEKEGDGAVNAATSFHRNLILHGERSMRCSILEDRVAVWYLRGTRLRLSALAADVLVGKRKITWKNLKLIRHRDWNDFEGPGEPFTGGGAALVSTMATAAQGLGSVPSRLAKGAKHMERHQVEKRKARRRRESKGKPGTTKQDGNSQSGVAPESQQVPTGGIAAHDHAKGSEDQQDTQLAAPDTDHAAISSHESLNTLDSASVAALEEEKLAQEMVNDAGTRLEKSGEALAKAPMNLSLAVAQGFHNAPRLYGDETVRRPKRVSGIQSGMRAAGSEFAYGIYDGVTGLFAQPYHGAQDEGVVGFAKGMGKGGGGFVLKGISAIVGPVGYTLKGMHKQIQRRGEPGNHARKARIIEGQRQAKSLSGEEERRATIERVAKGWRVVVEVKRQNDRTKSEGLRGRWRARRQLKAWREAGALDNVHKARRALRASRQGRDLDDEIQNPQHPTSVQSTRHSTTSSTNTSPSMVSATDDATGGSPRTSSWSRRNGSDAASSPSYGTRQSAVARPTVVPNGDVVGLESTNRKDIPRRRSR